MSQDTTGASLLFQGDCPKCNNRGYLVKKRYVEMYGTETDIAVPCECSEMRKIQRLFQASQITEGFLGLTFENFETKGVHPIAVTGLRCARHYVDNFDKTRGEKNNWLALLGEPGAGKTHLICGAAIELMKKGYPCLYFPHVEVMSELRKMAYSNGTEAVDDKIRKVKEVEILIWDDLWKSRKTPTDFETEVTFNILNYRYINHLPTLFSSEHTDEVLVGIDKAIGSRIIERSKGHMVIYQPGPKDKMPLNYRLR